MYPTECRCGKGDAVRAVNAVIVQNNRLPPFTRITSARRTANDPTAKDVFDAHGQIGAGDVPMVRCASTTKVGDDGATVDVSVLPFNRSTRTSTS